MLFVCTFPMTVRQVEGGVWIRCGTILFPWNGLRIAWRFPLETPSAWDSWGGWGPREGASEECLISQQHCRYFPNTAPVSLEKEEWTFPGGIGHVRGQGEPKLLGPSSFTRGHVVLTESSLQKESPPQSSVLWMRMLHVLTAGRCRSTAGWLRTPPGSFSFTTPATHVGWWFSLLLSGIYSFGVT